MIPEWSTSGDLPPGVHFATWQELRDRLGFNPRRHRMLAGFRQACEELRKAGCRLVYLDGSFVTRKGHPGDFDACWDVRNVDDDRLDPVFRDFSRGRAAQKQRQAVCEFLPDESVEWRTERDSGDQARKESGK